MRKPKNVNEFKELIESMQHRERFVFDLKKDSGILEVYSTMTNEGFGDQNISLKLISEKDNLTRNRLLKNWDSQYYKQIFELLN